METWYYEVVSIDGDYANLRRTDIPSEDLKLVARAASGGDYGRKQIEIRADAVRDCGRLEGHGEKEKNTIRSHFTFSMC